MVRSRHSAGPGFNVGAAHPSSHDTMLLIRYVFLPARFSRLAKQEIQSRKTYQQSSSLIIRGLAEFSLIISHEKPQRRCLIVCVCRSLGLSLTETTTTGPSLNWTRRMISSQAVTQLVNKKIQCVKHGWLRRLQSSVSLSYDTISLLWSL